MYKAQSINEHCEVCVYYPPNLPVNAYAEEDYQLLQEKECAFDFLPLAEQPVINDHAALGDLKIGKGVFLKYLSTSPSPETEQETGGVLMEIESNVEALAALGVKQEVCAVATRVFGIENDKLLPDLTLVGDGFISLIGYQAQGYLLVPVF